MPEDLAATFDADAAPSQNPLSYVELLQTNREFRRLWLGQVISQTGDWFDTIALFQIALRLTDSGRAVALILTVRFLSTVIASPLAGVVADRFNRKTIMVLSDLSRAIVVLGFLFVRQAEDVWLIYFLTVLQLVASTFFEPARSAAIPSVVEPKDLLTANAITSATWSAMLTLGAALGGLITAWLGTDAAFVIDSLTFLVSASIIYGLRLPARPARKKEKLTLARITGLADLSEGLAYVWQRPRVFAYVLAKPAWGIAGGMLTLLAVFGEKVYPVAGNGALGTSVLYVIRGVGTALGPIALRNFVGTSREKMETTLGAAFFVGGFFYVLFGSTSIYPLALLWLFMAYTGGSVVWLNATVLLQAAVEDEFRGRVFALELALLTLVLAASSYLTGELLDRFAYSPHEVIISLGALAAVPGAIWFLTRKFWQKQNANNG